MLESSALRGAQLTQLLLLCCKDSGQGVPAPQGYSAAPSTYLHDISRYDSTRAVLSAPPLTSSAQDSPS